MSAAVLLPFPPQRALAGAMATAMSASMTKAASQVSVGRLDWRRFPDGESLVAIEDQLEGADVVIASRMMKGAVNEEDRQLLRFRKWANNAFNLLANLFFRRSGQPEHRLPEPWKVERAALSQGAEDFQAACS